MVSDNLKVLEMEGAGSSKDKLRSHVHNQLKFQLCPDLRQETLSKVKMSYYYSVTHFQ